MLANWDPFHELTRMQDEMSRWIGHGNGKEKLAFRPAVDIQEDKEAYTLHVDLPGVAEKDVHIDLENGVLTIKGERHFEKKEEKEGGYRHVERSYGAFTRRFTIPETVKDDAIEAKLKEGVLTVRLPKGELPKGRKIAVTA
ncbi:MAG: Hsp20/alpha crystallin family protein [Polyangiales bacterium]